jgi:Alkylmercury lyase
MSASPNTSVELLYFDGCPNYDALLPRLRELLEETDGEIKLDMRRIDTEEEARRSHFLGSPTVRVDGRDVEPGADAREDYGLECRLYRTVDGGIVGLPPDELLVAALRGGRLEARSQPLDAPSTLWASDILNGRPVKDRLNGSPAPHRDLHRKVLGSFLAGKVPSTDLLRSWAAELGIELDDAVADLQQRDVMWLDPEAGLVTVAYPFSGTPTEHRVELRDSGSEIFAMCAVDALGVPFLAGQLATVRSRDMMSGDEIEVLIDPIGVREWEPRGVVVLAAISGDGPSASSCCPHVNFVSSREGAKTLLEKGSTQDGQIFEMREAIDLGERLFGTLLHEN